MSCEFKSDGDVTIVSCKRGRPANRPVQPRPTAFDPEVVRMTMNQPTYDALRNACEFKLDGWSWATLAGVTVVVVADAPSHTVLCYDKNKNLVKTIKV